MCDNFSYMFFTSFFSYKMIIVLFTKYFMIYSTTNRTIFKHESCNLILISMIMDGVGESRIRYNFCSSIFTGISWYWWISVGISCKIKRVIFLTHLSYPIILSQEKRYLRFTPTNTINQCFNRKVSL